MNTLTTSAPMPLLELARALPVDVEQHVLARPASAATTGAFGVA